MQEFVDEGDEPESDIVYRQLLVACPQRPALLVPPHHTFNEVAPSIRGAVKGLVPRLILTGGDDRRDVMTLQPTPNGGVAVAFISGQPLGPAGTPSQPWALRAEQDHGERLRLVPLAGRDPEGQHRALPLTYEVHLGAKSSLRAPQRMIGRLLHA